MPVGWPVILRANGTNMRSYNGIKMIMKINGMIGNEAGGMSKDLVMLVSMERPCWMEKVWS